MCVLMWGEKQIANLAKTEFDVLLNPAYVQQLVQDIHEESAHLTDEEYENQLTVDYILAVMEKDIGRKPKRSFDDDIQTNASLDT